MGNNWGHHIYVHNRLLTFNYLDLDLDITDILLDIFKLLQGILYLLLALRNYTHIYRIYTPDLQICSLILTHFTGFTYIKESTL